MACPTLLHGSETGGLRAQQRKGLGPQTWNY
jgi:hypothetical protein